MKGKIFILAALTLLLGLVFAMPAAAQSTCGGVSFSVTPIQGVAGSQATASGSGALENYGYTIYWDSTSGQVLASGTADASGNFSTTVTIPSDATVGIHGIIFVGLDQNEGSVECPYVFEVVAATGSGGVQPDAYTSARTTLPSTGAFLLPAAGLLAAGAGLLYRRRRR